MIFLYSHWLKLPIATRHALARQFNIIKKNPTHVVDDQVREDGYVLGDIESALTVPAMSAYTGLPFENAEMLWNDVIAKAEGRVVTVEEKMEEILAPVAAIEEALATTPISVAETSGKAVHTAPKATKKVTKKK